MSPRVSTVSIVSRLPGRAEVAIGDEAIRVAILGRPNVGKSSLLNALEPVLRLETGEISAKWDRGRHTTSRSTWLRLRGGGVVIDTPGVREIGTGPVDPEQLGAVYPEIALAAAGCRFRDCRHQGEPGCAVSAEVPPDRLANYQKLLRDAQRGEQTPLQRIAARQKWKKLHKAGAQQLREKRG